MTKKKRLRGNPPLPDKARSNSFNEVRPLNNNLIIKCSDFTYHRAFGEMEPDILRPGYGHIETPLYEHYFRFISQIDCTIVGSSGYKNSRNSIACEIFYSLCQVKGENYVRFFEDMG